MEKTLTPRQVDELQCLPGQRRTLYYDNHPDAPPGFVLRVTDRGSKTFFLIATVKAAGRRVWVRIGPARGAGLDQARRAAHVRYGEIQRDINPNEVARAAKARAQAERLARAAAAVEWTVSAMMRAHYDAQLARDELTGETPVRYRQVLDRMEKDPLGRMMARTVVRDDIRRWMQRKERDGPTAATMPFNRIRAAYNWAMDEEVMVPDEGGRMVARPRVDRDPTRGLDAAESSRARVLSDAELVRYWRALEGARVVQAVFARVILLCGTRKTETARAVWSNLSLEKRDEFDEPQWFIPAEDRKGVKTRTRTARRRPMTIPLSPLAVAELLRLRLVQPANRPRVFRGVQSTGKIGAELQAATGIRDVTIHDLRRTCATGIQGLGAPPHVISVVLGHSREKGATKTDATYARDPRFAEHRHWLQRWAAHIEGLLST